MFASIKNAIIIMAMCGGSVRAEVVGVQFSGILREKLPTPDLIEDYDGESFSSVLTYDTDIAPFDSETREAGRGSYEVLFYRGPAVSMLHDIPVSIHDWSLSDVTIQYFRFPPGVAPDATPNGLGYFIANSGVDYSTRPTSGAMLIQFVPPASAFDPNDPDFDMLPSTAYVVQNQVVEETSDSLGVLRAGESAYIEAFYSGPGVRVDARGGSGNLAVVDSPAPIVPEPATLLLLAAGVALLVGGRRLRPPTNLAIVVVAMIFCSPARAELVGLQIEGLLSDKFDFPGEPFSITLTYDDEIQPYKIESVEEIGWPTDRLFFADPSISLVFEFPDDRFDWTFSNATITYYRTPPQLTPDSLASGYGVIIAQAGSEPDFHVGDLEAGFLIDFIPPATAFDPNAPAFSNLPSSTYVVQNRLVPAVDFFGLLIPGTSVYVAADSGPDPNRVAYDGWTNDVSVVESPAPIVPEPATVLLFACGSAILVSGRREKKLVGAAVLACTLFAYEPARAEIVGIRIEGILQGTSDYPGESFSAVLTYDTSVAPFGTGTENGVVGTGQTQILYYQGPEFSVDFDLPDSIHEWAFANIVVQYWRTPPDASDPTFVNGHAVLGMSFELDSDPRLYAQWAVQFDPPSSAFDPNDPEYWFLPSPAFVVEQLPGTAGNILGLTDRHGYGAVDVYFSSGALTVQEFGDAMSASVVESPTPIVPEPASMWLLASAALCLASFRRMSGRGRKQSSLTHESSS